MVGLTVMVKLIEGGDSGWTIGGGGRRALDSRVAAEWRRRWSLRQRIGVVGVGELVPRRDIEVGWGGEFSPNYHRDGA